MNSRSNMKMGALGGPNTFGAEAAHLYVQSHPEFTEIVYFKTSEEGFEFSSGRSDALCAPQQMARTGAHPGIQASIARPDSKLYVLGEVTHAYHCSLLVKPGSPLEGVKRVLGHTGSVTQSREWLAKNLPGAEVVIVDTSSMGAAESVANGDGSIASIGTSGMAREFHLEERAKDIDGGSVGSYWAISPHEIFSDAPARIVVAGRFDDRGELSEIIGSIASRGFHLETVFQLASGKRLYEYDYVFRFAGTGTLSSVRAAIQPFSTARLVGAFT
jgi:prephenate dehydratase